MVCRWVWSRNHKNPREWGGGQGPLGGYRAKRENIISSYCTSVSSSRRISNNSVVVLIVVVVVVIIIIIIIIIVFVVVLLVFFFVFVFLAIYNVHFLQNIQILLDTLRIICVSYCGNHFIARVHQPYFFTPRFRHSPCVLLVVTMFSDYEMNKINRQYNVPFNCNSLTTTKEVKTASIY